MLRIVYRNYEFLDANREIISVQGSLNQSLIMDALSADECTLTISYDPAALGYYVEDATEGSGFLYTVNGEIVMTKTTDAEVIEENMAPFEAGFANAEPVDIYDDNVFFKRFYVTQALPVRLNRDGSIVIQLKAVSFIGLTVYMSHNGGIYTNSTVGAIIAEILKATKNTSQSTTTVYWYDMANGLHYTMDANVAKVRADGYLPITDRYRTARDNIRDVCFGYGVSVLQQPDGSAHFTYNQPSSVINIPDEEIYSGDAYSRHEAVTEVKVIANTYRQYSGEDPVVLWESTNVVSSIRVLFDEPCWGLYSSQVGGADTITIEESGVNYAVISGTGTLYGIPYLHTQEEFSRTIGTGVENVKTGDCGMVGLLNYGNVLDRMANYYANAREVSASFVVKNGASTGSLVSFNDPLGRAKTGIIGALDFVMSGIVKGDSKITTNWTPTDVGNNFSLSQILTGSGTWSKAAAEAAVGHAIDLVRFDIVSGGDGGAAGENGKAGTSGRGGAGGAGGAGGQSGKIFTVTLEGDQIPATITFACGEGGEPGAAGQASTLTVSGTTYSSEAGVRTQAGYMDLLTGEVRALPGPDGIAGGTGGFYSNFNDFKTGELRGESVTYKGRTWAAGDYSTYYAHWRYVYRMQSGRLIPTDPVAVVSAPGCSGGAAFGASSANAPGGGTMREIYTYDGTWIGVGEVISDTSSAGANALPIDDYVPELGSGGAGGNGGGGGGSKNASTGAGGERYSTIDEQFHPLQNVYNDSGTAGAGGTGSEGTAGGAGFITVYV